MLETIGQQLKRAREERNLTFKEVTKSTHIQPRLIEAMETDDFDSMPSSVQARAFLRLYAEFLGLSIDDLIVHQRAGADEPTMNGHIAASTPAQLEMSEKDADGVAAAEPGDELQKNNSQHGLHENIRDLTIRVRQILPQRRKPSSPIETDTQMAPPEPEPISDGGDEVQRTRVKETIPETTDEPLPKEKTASNLRSQAIFNRIGETLHERREALSLTLDEIEDHTHVRKHYLEALEAGDFGHLPSSVQTRGMLNNYAHFLDLDVDAILLQFAEGLQIQRLERQPTPIEKTGISDARPSSKTILAPGLRRYLSMDVIVGVGLILILLSFAIWGTTRVINLRSANIPLPTAQPISNILEATQETVTTTPVPTNELGTVTIIPTVISTAIVTVPAAGQGPVQIVVVALEQAFVRVTVDGKRFFDGRVNAGTAYPFDGNTQIEVLTGNGAAISILFNESDLGPMGGLGEVVDRIYTANAILNPTATVTPSPTITPTPTVTPRPSPTPRPGSTLQIPTATQGHG